MDPAKGREESPEAPNLIPRSGKRFGGALAITYPDPDHSVSEQRFLTVGMSGAGRVLLVAHADREEIIRIISERKATPREREQYEEEG